MKKNFYISTAIHYASAAPHMGHALENVLTDSIARYKRLRENDVFFVTGTDENGVKVYNSAKKAGVSPQDFCDANAKNYEELTSLLSMENSDFIRTTDQKRHWPSVQKLWQSLEENGDIYKKSYTGLYCVGCERYIPEKDLDEEGHCKIHKTKPEAIEEENYFFKLSKYSDKILAKIEARELDIVPDFRRNEILSLLRDGGLKDVSFSRPKSSLPWGVPVPTDSEHNMYVWCDALTNYISVLDYANNSENYQKYWENAEKVHVIGKDIVRFHAGIWIGMLMSAALPLPDKILIHGFLTSEGQKMSKTLGNTVDPIAELENYGVDALRYFFLTNMSVGQDGDFSRQRFEEMYNAKLANNLGNFINRVYVLSAKNEITPNPDSDFAETEVFKKELEKTWQTMDACMGKFELNESVAAVWSLLDFANKKMDEHKPWLLAKENPEALKSIMPLFLELSRQLAFMLEPFLPDASKRIKKVLGIKGDFNYQEKSTWGGDTDWKALGEKTILFPRLEK
jgi:methionyl-tRNA synthetase